MPAGEATCRGGDGRADQQHSPSDREGWTDRRPGLSASSPRKGVGRGGVGSSAQNNGGKVATGQRGSPPSRVQIPVRPGPSRERLHTWHRAMQAGSVQSPEAPAHLARLRAHHKAQQWQCGISSPHTRGTDWETESGEDASLSCSPALDPGAKIGICLETIAGIISVGRYHCGQSFETLRMCWL